MGRWWRVWRVIVDQNVFVAVCLQHGLCLAPYVCLQLVAVLAWFWIAVVGAPLVSCDMNCVEYVTICMLESA